MAYLNRKSESCSDDSSVIYVKHNIFISFIIIVLLVLNSSHSLLSLLNIEVKKAFACAFMVLFFAAYFKKRKMNGDLVLLAIFMLFFGVIGSLISGAILQLKLGFLVASILFVSEYSQQLILSKNGLSIIIFINLLILAGACIGLIYAMIGGQPIMMIPNQETGKPIYLYLTTFTNSINFGVIRPSGIFDEPGALAFFSIIVTCFNEIRGGNRRITIVILFLNLFSLSLVAFIAFVLFVVINIKIALNFKNFIISCVIITGIVISYNHYGRYVEHFYLDRLRYEDGSFAGDNRSNQVLDFIYLVDLDIFLCGSKSIGFYKKTDQSSNPFSILYASGVFVWVPYALLILWLLSSLLQTSVKIVYVKLVFALLLLQRPYIYSLYWGIIIWALAVAIYRCNLKNSKRNARIF